MKQLFLDNRLFYGTEEELLSIKDFYKKEWKLNRVHHREGGPAVICKDTYSHEISEYWYQNGLWHRLDGAAITEEGIRYEWYENGRLHRVDGPAIRDFFSEKGGDWFLFGGCFSDWFPMDLLFGQNNE